MTQLAFYFRYAFKNIIRGGRWMTLAILCIAAGVATIVALRGLGLAIKDSLLENVRLDNRGDVLLRQGQNGGFAFNFDTEQEQFTAAQIERVEAWVEEADGIMTAYMIGSNVQIAAQDFESAGRPQFISSYFIDPQTYPPTGAITTIDPPDVPLADLFTGEKQIIISQNLAESQGIEVGEQVHVSDTEDMYTVVGIVSTQNEAGFRNLFGAFFGFAYFDLEQARADINAEYMPNRIGVLLPGNPTPDEIDNAAEELERISGAQRSVTVNSRLQENEVFAQLLNDFIVVMGLGALLIGGVGILNTMLVMIRRRTNEIASLKTFGLKGGQIALLFLIEAFLLGLAGSVIGSIVGVLLGGVVNQYGEAFLQQPIPWRIYPEALIYGYSLGLVVTMVFGVAPILTAVKVRPNVILRPNETAIPRLGILQTLALMIFVTLSIGLIVGQIVQPSFQAIVLESEATVQVPSPYLVGVISVSFTLLFLAILVGVLWILVWLIGKLPAFGSVDLRLALRNLSTQRTRTATTLLALSAGMFALSSITFVGQGTREILNLQLANQLGGNVLAFSLLPGTLGDVAINAGLSGVEGIDYRTTFSSYEMDFLEVDGEDVYISQREIRESFRDGDGPAQVYWNNIVILETDNPNYPRADLVEGRYLTEEDAGKPVLVGPYANAAPLGIEIGSILTYRSDNGNIYEFEVVGLVEQQSGFAGDNIVLVPDGSLDGVSPEFRFYSFFIEDEAATNNALVSLSSIPLVFSLDISFFDNLLARLIDQFVAIPTVVGLLSLLAAAVIMANTVALSTLERRRQIGILKSVGLKSRRVLVVMLIETTIIGLLSAFIGLGLSSLFVTLFTSYAGTPLPLPADARLEAVALVIAAVLIAWSATFLSANVAVRERVMNVLRYE